MIITKKRALFDTNVQMNASNTESNLKTVLHLSISLLFKCVCNNTTVSRHTRNNFYIFYEHCIPYLIGRFWAKNIHVIPVRINYLLTITDEGILIKKEKKVHLHFVSGIRRQSRKICIFRNIFI